MEVERLPGAPFPRPSAPDFALDSWRMVRDDPAARVPAGLFPWCYEGHAHLLVELEAPGAVPGTVFEWGFGDATMVLRYRSIGDWMAVLCDVLREGSFESGAALHIDTERANELAAERLAARGPHPVYGTATAFALDRSDWPEHWTRISDTARRDPPARAPLRTIAAVQAARRDGPVTATVTGVAHYIGGRAGHGRRIMLWDGTGHLDVWCPAEIRGHGLLDGTPPFRLEIEAERWTGPQARPDFWPFGDPVPAGAVLPTHVALLEHVAPEATATIVHRI